MAEEGVIEIDGFKLKYRTEGCGPDVLVIGSSVYYPRSFSQNLRKYLRLHFIDYRGFAEGPPAELTFETLLKDIECFRQKLCVEKCIVVGHSAHGFLALEYAKKYKEHVSHAIVIGMPPHMGPKQIAMAQKNWEESASPKRKEAFKRNMQLMPDAKLNLLPKDQWFIQMNLRNAPKSWYNYHFDATPLWQGVTPNSDVLDQMYLQHACEVDLAKGLESLDIPVLLALGRFEFLFAVNSWDSLRPKFKNLTTRIFEKSAHSPQYEEAERFDAELLKWLKKNMIAHATFSHQSIIDCLESNYGIVASSLTRLPLGADINASVYKAETRSQGCYFVKLKQGHSRDMSVAILALLHSSGIEQIILPIRTIHGQQMQRMPNSTLTVYPFIDGQNGFCCGLKSDQWLALGAALRQVHEIKVPPEIESQIRKETYSSKWRDIVRTLYAHMDDKPTGDEPAMKLRAFMKEHRATIHRLVDRAEALSQKVQQQSPELVLCHSDIHGGNVLITEKDAFFIVDWDDPMLAPKERDLMFIGGGVANVWNDPREEASFYEGYGKTEINRDILAYYRHERIVEDIAEYGQALLMTAEGGESRIMMHKHFVDMFETNGVVDIAFRTDSGPRAHLIASEKEKKLAIDFRQKHFFDRLNIQDPYTWTFDLNDHLHWLLYEGEKVIGYAHVQIWPGDRAALRIIVIDEQKRAAGMGKGLMESCERALKHRGVTLFQTEASPSACQFYKKLGFTEMAFNNPDGEPTHPDDLAMGKYL